ncbi:MAG: hypothetical protein ABIJ21_04375 [Nanoarchaeota archaeon]
MVVLTSEQWEDLITRLEDGEDRSQLVDSLMNQGYTLLEAEAIGNKAQASYDLEKRKEALRKKTLRHRLNRPSVTIFVLAILIGILLPLIYFELSVNVFSFTWGFPWMFYVFGNWVFCLVSGNLPGGFSDDGGMMVASCKYIGEASSMQHAISDLGGLFFTLMVGIFLVIYMILQSARAFKDRDVKSDEKKWKYISALFNGSVGFSCITAITYALHRNISGEMALDIISVSSAFSLENMVFIRYLQTVSYVFIAITVVLVGYHIIKDVRMRSLS